MPKPLLTRSELTGRVYVVTAYKSGPNGTIVASRKHDVTDQFERLIGVPGETPMAEVRWATSISVPDGETPTREVIAARIDLDCAEYHEHCCSWLMWSADESLFDSMPDCDCGGPAMAKAYAEGCSDSGGPLRSDTDVPSTTHRDGSGE